MKIHAAHEDFAKRFLIACDDNPNVPEMNFGRLTWIANEFKKRFDVDVTSETVRKWKTGISPNPDTVGAHASQRHQASRDQARLEAAETQRWWSALSAGEPQWL